MNLDKLILDYVNFIFYIVNIEKNWDDLENGGVIIAHHHTKEELEKAIGYTLDATCIEKLKQIWLSTPGEIYCFCCGDFFINAIYPETKELVNQIHTECLGAIVTSLREEGGK